MVEETVITDALPCIADPAKIQFRAQPSSELTKVLPYLNAVVQGDIYNHDLPGLTLTKEHRIISLYSHRITCAKADNIEDARAVIEWLKDFNDTWARRDKIEPSYTRPEQLIALAIDKLLPGTNSGRCGDFMYLALGAEQFWQEVRIRQGPRLLQGQEPQTRALLAELLIAAGCPIHKVRAQAERSSL